MKVYSPEAAAEPEVFLKLVEQSPGVVRVVAVGRDGVPFERGEILEIDKFGIKTLPAINSKIGIQMRSDGRVHIR